MRLKDLLLGCLLLGLFLKITAEIAKKNPEDDSSKETVSITKWQYCLSCKETVNLYVKLASDEIQSMQKSGKPALSSLEANQLAHFICDHSSFNHFQPWMKFGCMKLMEDHSIDFLQQFAGHVTINDIINKAENYGRKRRICGKYAKACHPSEFKKSNITKSERTKCTACRLIAKDVEDLQRQFKKAATFKNYLSEEYCKQIGYSFHPYLWMEEICEEMVDDHLKDILDILNLQNGIKKTGFSPSESTDYMMCKEFYKCKKNANTNNSNEDLDEDEL